MALASIADLELLVDASPRPARDRDPLSDARSPVRWHRTPPRQAFGPRSEPVVALLDRARALTAAEIETLALRSGTHRHGARYTEALLAARRAAERSGRFAATGLAGTEAERIVVGVAESRRPDRADDCARWSVVGQQAAWAASDAARALVVADLISVPQLRVLTQAWDFLG